MFDGHFCLVFEKLDGKPLLKYFTGVQPTAQVRYTY